MPDQPIATHPHEDHQEQRPDPADTVAAAQRWAVGFASAPLVPAEAADLASSALGITSAVANAARRLDWQTPDAFIAMLRRAEKSNDR